MMKEIIIYQTEVGQPRVECLVCHTSAQGEGYKYPDVWVCLYESHGCDAKENEDDCVYSSSTTQGGFTTATFNPDCDDEQEIAASAVLTDDVCSYLLYFIFKVRCKPFVGGNQICL